MFCSQLAYFILYNIKLCLTGENITGLILKPDVSSNLLASLSALLDLLRLWNDLSVEDRLLRLLLDEGCFLLLLLDDELLSWLLERDRQREELGWSCHGERERDPDLNET